MPPAHCHSAVATFEGETVVRETETAVTNFLQLPGTDVPPQTVALAAVVAQDSVSVIYSVKRETTLSVAVTVKSTVTSVT